jgi:hypothetical protein
MADGADVRSIDAVRDWHAALVDYADTLSEALAGVALEIRRAHDWLGEQLVLWQRAVKKCEEDITRAKAELSQRKFPNWDGREPDCTVQERNLRRAKARLQEAEDQVEKCREWIGRLPQAVDEVYTGPARRLGNLLEGDLPKGMALLARRVAALEAYAGLRPDYAPGSSATSVAPPPPAPVSQKEGGAASPSPSGGGVGEGSGGLPS